VVSKLGLRRVAWAAVGIIITVPIVRAISFWHGWDVFPSSWCRFDGIASGAFLATLVRLPGHSRGRLFRFSLGCLAAAAVLFGLGMPLGIYTRTRLFGATFMYTDVNLFFAGMVGLVGSGNIPVLNAQLLPLHHPLFHLRYVELAAGKVPSQTCCQSGKVRDAVLACRSCLCDMLSPCRTLPPLLRGAYPEDKADLCLSARLFGHVVTFLNLTTEGDYQNDEISADHGDFGARRKLSG
jgi:hypothetical protein